MRSGPGKNWRIVLWTGSLPALLAASFLYYPYCLDGPVFCPIRLVMGVPCPGCGLTRAFCYMTHGHFREAMTFNAIAPLVLAYVTFLWGYKVIEAVRGVAPRLPVYKIGGTACTTIVVFWIARLAFFFFKDDGLHVVLRENLILRVVRLLS